MIHDACVRVRPPRADEFSEGGVGWYVLGKSNAITNQPIRLELLGGELVCFRISSGKPVAMDIHCWHMGADLSLGKLVEDQIECPFHGWRYGASGYCEFIPSQAEIPSGARQRTYCTAERAGYVFVFPHRACDYPPPFFDGIDPAELVAAAPFDLVVDCPWWLVGTNGFDLQHFSGLHDRRLVASPRVESPHPMARRILATFEVCGETSRDRLIRRFAGRWVTMDVTVWSGTLAFVMAKFHDARNFDDSSIRTTSYGMTEIRGIGCGEGQKSLVRVTIFRRRRRGLSWLDKLDARIKRNFIHAFLKPDVLLLSRARYNPDRLIDADREMIDYLCWLAAISRLESFCKEPA
jgi:phenylpropionate dioxygenase-like ring-hydroxylating dioxygenase large terminal subunit